MSEQIPPKASLPEVDVLAADAGGGIAADNAGQTLEGADRLKASEMFIEAAPSLFPPQGGASGQSPEGDAAGPAMPAGTADAGLSSEKSPDGDRTDNDFDADELLEQDFAGTITAPAASIVRRPLPLFVLLFLLHLYISIPLLAVVGAQGLMDWQQRLEEANVVGFGFSCIFYLLGLGVAAYTAVLIHRRLPPAQPFSLIIMSIYLLLSMGTLGIGFLVYRLQGETTELVLIMVGAALCSCLYAIWFCYFKSSPVVRRVFNIPPPPESDNL